jgi:hypothetical protein
MKAFLTFTFALAFFCLLAASTAVGQGVPQLINVQGKLTDAVGDPVADGPYSVLFSIYDVITGGTALWQETRTVTVSDGLFSISLGESTTIPPSLFDNTDLWLGIKVETDPEMTPRQRLTTAPYSFRSSGAAVGGGWADDGNVVRLETSTDSVGIGTTSPEAKLHVVGDAGGAGVRGVSSASGGLSQYAAVAAINTSSGPGLYASSGGWHAVLGINNSDAYAAIMGRNNGFGPGIRGQNQGTGPAITGYASSGNLLELYNTPGPNLRFSISNDGYVQADSTIESTSGGFKFPDGTVQTTAAVYGGPIAYGVINVDGTVASGTPNISSSWNGTSSRYEITISGENYIYGSYVTVVTVLSGDARLATTNSVSGNLLVFVFNSSGTAIQDNFHFVTYKP